MRALEPHVVAKASQVYEMERTICPGSRERELAGFSQYTSLPPTVDSSVIVTPRTLPTLLDTSLWVEYYA